MQRRCQHGNFDGIRVCCKTQYKAAADSLQRVQGAGHCGAISNTNT